MNSLIPRAHRANIPVPAATKERAVLREVTNLTSAGPEKQRITKPLQQQRTTLQQQQARKRKIIPTNSITARAVKSPLKQENVNPNKKPRRTQGATVFVKEAPPSTTNQHDSAPMDTSDVSMVDEIEQIDQIEPGTFTELEYANNIISYLMIREKTTMASPAYLLAHKEVNENMRTILVNWMIEVHLEFQTETETLYLAVSVLDRYLERNPHVSRKQLQLVGMTALFVACKFEQTYLPTVEDFVDMADNAYTYDDVLEMENNILDVINWEMSVPTPIPFLKRFCKAAQFDTKMEAFSHYFAELTIPEYGMLSFPPSLIAAASVFITRRLNGIEPYWTPTLAHYTKYTEEDLRPCAKSMIHILKKEAVRFTKAEHLTDNKPCTIKYSCSKFHSVAPAALARVGRNAALRSAKNHR